MHINFNVFVYLAILFRNLPINNVFVSISALVRFRYLLLQILDYLQSKQVSLGLCVFSCIWTNGAYSGLNDGKMKKLMAVVD